jgi:proteasome lid subunit RPN8/RPN11
MWNEKKLQETEIIWEESDDVYQPIVKKLSQFLSEKGISYQKSQIYILEDAFHSITNHLESDVTIEQGGILFGHAYQDPNYDRSYVEITAAIPAPATIGTGSHLEFTSESWSGIMEYARKKHPQENIVGWYHSHPNIGVFMSATDWRTQRAFFYHPWSVSIVCDPVRQEIGCFLGKMALPVQAIVLQKKYLPKRNLDIKTTNRENRESKMNWFQLALLFMAGVLVPLAVFFTWIIRLFVY